METMQTVLVQVVIFSAYGAIIFGGMLCNVLFIVSVAVSQEKKRSVTRMLIANLALSDLFMLSLSLFPPVSVIQDNWPFGEFWCKVTQFVSALSIFVSSFSTMAIALHRYVRIVQLRRGKSHPVYAWSMIAATWCASVCFSAPIFVKARVVNLGELGYIANSTKSKCAEKWDSEFDDRVFTLACLVVQFLLPIIVIAVCYGKVSVVLRNRLHFHMSMAHHQDQQLLLLIIQRQRRTIHALVVIFSMYLLCWMPYNVFIVTLVFNLPWMSYWRYMEVAYVAAHVLAVSSGIHNPIIYSWMHAEFRTQARLDLARCCRTLARAPQLAHRRPPAAKNTIVVTVTRQPSVTLQHVASSHARQVCVHSLMHCNHLECSIAVSDSV